MKKLLIILIVALSSCHSEVVKDLETNQIIREHNIPGFFPNAWTGDTAVVFYWYLNTPGARFEGHRIEEYRGYTIPGQHKAIMIDWHP